MIATFFKGTSSIILLIALMRSVVTASQSDKGKDQDRFIYTSLVSITFALMLLGAI